MLTSSSVPACPMITSKLTSPSTAMRTDRVLCRLLFTVRSAKGWTRCILNSCIVRTAHRKDRSCGSVSSC